MKKAFVLILLIGLLTNVFAQQVPFTKEELFLRNHVSTLADDNMEGRATGTKGETKAAEYIVSQFKRIGLKAAGTNGYYQSFQALAGKNFGPENGLTINKKEVEFKSDYFPLELSSNGEVKGKLYKGLSKKSKNKIVVIDLELSAAANPHEGGEVLSKIRNFTDQASEKKAKALVFVNSGDESLSPVPDYTRNMNSVGLPVVFVDDASSILKAVGKKASVKVDMVNDMRSGKNVIAKIDNGAQNYIVIGAHFDHLGYGEFGSRYTGKEKMIHNGADDNASGTALVIELARYFSENPIKDLNFLFIGFSGEEMGLLGSKYFVENSTIDMSSISYMINMDMIGRMNNRTLIVNGTGTSPAWGNLLLEAKPKRTGIELATNESGIGPSDHTSFYLKNIPVLAFFTGTHDDYHKPEDDFEKVNFSGMMMIRKYIINLIEASSDDGKLAFTKTKDPNQGASRKRFKVTLGVMPSYSFAGPGLKIDGVSDGNPAQKAGLEAGDIIIGIGKNEIADIYGYMDALGEFKKGDKTKVKVKRGEKEMEFDLEF